MKVTLTLTVDMPVEAREAWDREYGTGTSATEVREDLRTYLDTLVADSPGDGLIRKYGGNITVT